MQLTGIPGGNKITAIVRYIDTVCVPIPIEVDSADTVKNFTDDYILETNVEENIISRLNVMSEDIL